MWIPPRFEMPPERVLELLHDLGSADLITPSPDGVEVTFLPWVFDETVGEHGVLRSHLARLNPHARLLQETTAESLVVVHGPDAYITPAWYPSRETNPRAVPTWDYSVVHLHGRVRVVEDPEAVLRQVTEQAQKFEEPFADAWSITDAPADYIAGLCRAIVAVELEITRIEAKAKQSQDRTRDLNAIIAGLRSVGDHDNADEVQRINGR